MNRRIVTYKCFDMTPARQKELRYFCSQYQEWKDKLEMVNVLMECLILIPIT